MNTTTNSSETPQDGLDQLNVLWAQVSQIEGTYTHAIENLIELVLNQAMLTEEQREDLRSLFRQGVRDLRTGMFNSGVAMGYSLTQLGFGEATVDMVVGAFERGDETLGR